MIDSNFKSISELSTYCVYKHTNKKNNKSYVGITKFGNNPEKRWGKNGEGYLLKINGKYTQKKFADAINKYSWCGFEHEILKNNLTLIEAIFEEKLNIKKYDCINNGYNTLEGGCEIFYKRESTEGIGHVSDTKHLNGKHKELKYMYVEYLTSQIGHPNMLYYNSLKNQLIKIKFYGGYYREVFLYKDFKQQMLKVIDYHNDIKISEHYIPFQHIYSYNYDINYKIFSDGLNGVYNLCDKIDYCIDKRCNFGNMSGAAEVLYDYAGNLYREYFWDILDGEGTDSPNPIQSNKYPSTIKYETGAELKNFRQYWKDRIKNKYILESDYSEYVYEHCYIYKDQEDEYKKLLENCIFWYTEDYEDEDDYEDDYYNEEEYLRGLIALQKTQEILKNQEIFISEENENIVEYIFIYTKDDKNDIFNLNL